LNLRFRSKINGVGFRVIKKSFHDEEEGEEEEAIFFIY